MAKSKKERKDKYEKDSYEKYEFTGLDPSDVVTFRGLQKRDPTTREKALESLLTGLGDRQDYEIEAIISAWTGLYAALATDLSRRVRALSHEIHGILMRKSDTPLMIGVWVGGLYDTDKLVVRAVVNGFESVFGLDERSRVFLEYHSDLLDYASTSLDQDLSGMSAAPDKYWSQAELDSRITREIARGISLLSYLLSVVPPDMVVDQQDKYASIMTNKTLWSSVSSSDSHLSRVALTFVSQLAYDYNSWLKALPLYLSRYVIENGLMSLNSLEYLDCLITITRFYPSCWSANHLPLLYAFVSRNRSARSDFWKYIELLVENIPLKIDIDDLANAFNLDADRPDNPDAIDALLALFAYYIDLSDTSNDSTDVSDPGPGSGNENDGKDKSSLIIDKAIAVGVRYLSSTSTSDSIARSIATFYRKLALSNIILANKFWKSLVDGPTDINRIQKYIAIAKRLTDIPQIQSDTCSLIRSSVNNPATLNLLLAQFFSLVTGHQPTFDLISQFVSTVPVKLAQSSEKSLTKALIDVWITFDKQLRKDKSDNDNEKANIGTWTDLVEPVLSDDDSLLYLLSAVESVETYSTDLENHLLQRIDDGNFDSELILLCLTKSLITQETALRILSTISPQVELDELLTILSKLPLPLLHAFVQSDPHTTSGVYTNTSEQAQIIRNKLKHVPDIFESLASAVLSDLDEIDLLDSGSLDDSLLNSSLIDRAVSLFNSAPNSNLLFQTSVWSESVDAVMRPVATALALTNNIAGALYLVPHQDSEDEISLKVFRMAAYTVAMLQRTNILDLLEYSDRLSTFLYVLVVSELASDHDYEISTGVLLDQIVFSLSDLTLDVELTNDFSHDLLATLILHIDKTVMGFYCARVFSSIITLLADKPEFSLSDADALFTRLNLRRSKNTLLTVAITSGLSPFVGSMPSTARFRNELASDLLGVRSPDLALEKVVLVNSLIQDVDDVFPKQRAIMLVKHMLNLVESAAPALRAETAKLLASVVPVVSDLYGDHWPKLVEFIEACLEIHDDAVLYRALKLLLLLKTVDNDDAVDAVSQNTSIQSTIMLTFSTRTSKSKLCDALLSRVVLDTPVAEIPDLYDVLTVDSSVIQRTAVRLQSRVIAASNEELMVEAALDVRGVLTLELPVELLSLVVSPEDVRTYLYAWILIFEHFENSAFALKTKYIDSLKEGAYVVTLLEFLTSVIDLNAKSVATFDIAETYDNEDEEELRLALHIYNSALRHVPSIVRGWYMQIRNRQLSLALESFTQTHFSPLLIDAELKSVQTKLSESQTEDENMRVRVSRVTKEVTAVYTIDEQTIEMVIRVPPSYPLRDVHVDGTKRVGVKENQFRAWLLASQSVIVAQNGNIVDAIMLFNRNVALHFEGVTECAICYSILHQDRSLPNKKCQTCKNKFHAACLYKWFQSANASSCPLCRQNFTFGR